MKYRKRQILMIILSVSMLFCCSCAKAGKKSKTAKKNVVTVQGTGSRMALPDTQNTGQAEEEGESGQGQRNEKQVYVIMEHDLYNRQMTLYDISSDMSICYEYTDGTEFFNKYGDYTLAKEFSEGKLVQIKRLNSNETLGAVTFTDQVWDYEKAVNYSIDTAKNIFTLADEKYRCSPDTKVFTDSGPADIYSVEQGDVLDVYGEGRDIYSIVVRGGNGTLALKNTKLFEGGWMNLGTQVYTIILKDMEMDIPEGVYEFAVANDGYGDSGQIRIQRGKTTTIDLNDYKGEGPKLCRLNFHVGVEGATLVLDGKKVDVKQPLDVKYGVHTLSVAAAGYDTWTKKLVANSPKADIDIKLDNEGDADSGSGKSSSDKGSSGKNSSGKSSSGKSKSGKSAGRRAGTLAGSLAGSVSGSDSDDSSGSSSKNNNNSASSALASAALSSSLASIITGGDSGDYLDTLSNLVDSLDRLKKSKSDKEDGD